MEGEMESGTDSGGQEKREETLKQAQEAVGELFKLNTHYFDDHAVDCASKKDEDVREKLQQTLTTLDSLKDSLPKEQLLYLRGKCLNVLPDHSPEAEMLLSKAVKQDPSIADAWVALGETYWKKGNIQQAHDCFISSITHAKTKEALRNLSMVLRQMGTNPSEREARVKESVEKAKEAVGLDVKDGTSWMILGNAYLSLYFTTNQDSKQLRQTMSAYSQAEKDSAAANNPDLHYNKATLCLYEEDYHTALQELSRAAALDPAWKVPKDEITSTRRFLQSMTQSISSKGKMKSKKTTALIASLSSPEDHMGLFSEGRTLANFADLCEGSNKGKVFVGGITSIVPTKNRVPYACTLIDGSSSSVGLTVYNLAATTHFSIGDIVTLPDPDLKHVAMEEEIDFWSIQSRDPRLMLLNGEKLSAEKLATSVVTITAFN